MHPLRDEWFGFDRVKEPLDPATADEAWYRARSRILGEQYRIPSPNDDPIPSFEERVARCKEMGLVLCTCTRRS